MNDFNSSKSFIYGRQEILLLQKSLVIIMIIRICCQII